MFTETQKEELSKPLDKKKVKTRQQSGRDLSYIEAWHAIAEANRIFGFDGWIRETIYCKEVSRIECKVGKLPYQKNGYKIGYEAKVRITVGHTVREGTGHGCGQMSDLFDCIESAAKEAESDAMKRALMTFGNQFGLALYDKLQRGVEDVQLEPVELKTTKPELTLEEKKRAAKVTADEIAAEYKKCTNLGMLADVQQKYSSKLQRLSNGYEGLFKDVNTVGLQVIENFKTEEVI
jgi:DNA repair and recombination protein RAD52